MRKTHKATTPAIAVQRQKEVQAIIIAKLAMLRRYAKDGVPAGAFVPRSIEQFRLWTDERINLRPIGSKSTLYQPWNREYKTEILKLIELLITSGKKSKSRKTSSERLRIEVRELKFTLRQLAGEIHKTRQELQSSQLENERLTQRIKDLKEENSKLVAQLKKRTGLYPVK